MPEPLTGESLEASLTVKNLDESTAWYTNALGFVVDKHHERGGKRIAVSLHAGAVRILLTQDDGSKGVDRVKGEGLSFQITTRQSVDAIAAGLMQHGVVLDTEPTTYPWGVRVIRFRDPDGFRFTISSPAGAA
jgi:catechol 2,3-dioxygenase-like lactoylglutathione lyase family enzyme